MIERVSEAVLTPDDPRFPASLLQVRPVPGRLFARGDLAVLEQPMAAVVGSRTPSGYGERLAYRIAFVLARAGVVVVSGLAKGLDGRAHRGALDAGGTTIAVLGCGLDVPYPRTNADLLEAIPRRGLLLTEYEPGAPPEKWYFPARNRIIAALARCLVVVEGKIRGGTSNTVDWTLGLGKTVLAVPGRVDEPEAAGPNLLIANGARPLLSPADVLGELGLHAAVLEEDWFALDAEQALARREAERGHAGRARPAGTAAPSRGGADLGGAEARLYGLITPEPAHVDQLAVRAGLAPALVLAALSALELQGLVTQFPGKHFALAS